jgi:hypothetical protein
VRWSDLRPYKLSRKLLLGSDLNSFSFDSNNTFLLPTTCLLTASMVTRAQMSSLLWH